MVEMDRTIKRGGVYWIRSNDDWNITASPMGRPAVVVSNDFGNQHGSNVNVVFTTTGGKPISCNIPLTCTGKPSWAMCNKVATVGKEQIGNIMSVVSEEEMRAIDAALAQCLGLTLHKRDVDEALEAEKARVADLEQELMAKRIEIAMLERLYEKAVDMMAGVRLTKDVQQDRTPVKPRVPEVASDEPEVVEKVAVDKVNVNTASAKEISEKTGLSLTVCYSITGVRKRSGQNYKSLEDLLNVPKFTQHHLDTYGGKMSV